jgi:hypothetical protein
MRMFEKLADEISADPVLLTNLQRIIDDDALDEIGEHYWLAADVLIARGVLRKPDMAPARARNVT